MKKGVNTILISILILSSISFFGVVFIDHGVNEPCPFSAITSNNCETVVGGAASMLHHISAFQTFTEAFLTSGTGLLIMLLLVVVLLKLEGLFTLHTEQDHKLVNIRERFSISIPNFLLRWIALHNKRNAHLDFRRVVI